MLKEFGSVILAAHFAAYPSFGDRDIASPPPANFAARVEATIDRGPIVELILNCGREGDSAIISYAKIERRFCTPSLGCTNSITEAARRICR